MGKDFKLKEWVMESNSAIGKRFGELEVMYEIAPSHGKKTYICRCSCGKMQRALLEALEKGYVKRCQYCKAKMAYKQRREFMEKGDGL